MKIQTNDQQEQSCELTQLSISDAIDSGTRLSSHDAQHIGSCPECAHFHLLWHNNSPLTDIASGTLIEQQDLASPIISQLEQNKKTTHKKENDIISGRFFKLASIAAVIAIVTAFSFYGMDKNKDKDNEKPNIAAIKAPEGELELHIPKIDISLTEAEIERKLSESLEENYQNIKESATEKWKTATIGIARATEYIANGTHYISNKYLIPKNEGSNGPQSQLTPGQDEANHLQYA